MEAASELYGKAVARYTGDYYVDDSDGAWAITQREQLLTRYLVALERLGGALHMQGHHEAAINAYRWLVERDAYREDVYCNMMRCYATLGRRGDALAQYQRIASTLRDELGLDPDQQTQSFYRLR